MTQNRRQSKKNENTLMRESLNIKNDDVDNKHMKTTRKNETSREKHRHSKPSNKLKEKKVVDTITMIIVESVEESTEDIHEFPEQSEEEDNDK